jgi:hypothetical protein
MPVNVCRKGDDVCESGVGKPLDVRQIITLVCRAGSNSSMASNRGRGR